MPLSSSPRRQNKIGSPDFCNWIWRKEHLLVVFEKKNDRSLTYPVDNDCVQSNLHSGDQLTAHGRMMGIHHDLHRFYAKRKKISVFAPFDIADN